MSVLNNGGTPVVSRMPYDNKQCKAYKGLAIRYSGIADNSKNKYAKGSNNSKNSIDDIKIYGWKDKPQVEQDFYPDYMGEDGVVAKFGTNAIPLSADVVVPLDCLSAIIGDSKEEAPSTTLAKVSKYLTKVDPDTFEIITTENESVSDILDVFLGKSTTDGDYKDVLPIVNSVSDTDIYKYISAGYPETGTEFTNIQSAFEAVYGKYYDPNTGVNDALSGLKGYFNSKYNLCGVVYYTTIEGVISGEGKTNVSSTISGDITDAIKLTKKYIYNTEDFVNLDTDASYGNVLSSLKIADISTYILNSTDKFSVSDRTDDNKNFITGHVQNFFVKDTDQYVTIRRDVVERFKQMKDFINLNSINSAAIADYRFNGVPLSSINIPASTILNFTNQLTENDSNLLTTALIDLPGLLEDEDLSGDAYRFARMFNSPVFYNTDSLYDEEGYHESTQALIDSKVIAKSNLGYKNIIMLDSKEVTISNDQYDDLVTQSKFTDGDNASNPDAKNDINSRFRSDIRSANFIIVDKHKSIAAGEGSNEGIFAVIVDPYDGMKAQRLLYHNYTEAELQNN
jgi:hypothetical protein